MSSVHKFYFSYSQQWEIRRIFINEQILSQSFLFFCNTLKSDFFMDKDWKSLFQRFFGALGANGFVYEK